MQNDIYYYLLHRTYLIFHLFPILGYLTIGIPTVRRTKVTYFFKTLDSLLNCTTDKDLSEIFVVIFLADFNKTWERETSHQIQNKYPKLIEEGTIQVIGTQKEFYPQLDNLQHTFNDSEARTKWRSKQNVDYAFLWLYSKDMSNFYMQMEDDVLTIPGYLNVIKQFIAEQKVEWSCLEFSQIGFIGKVFHSKHLEALAKTVLLFYDKQPVDYLFMYFNYLNLQGNRIIRRPTIFRHFGYHSSLRGKTMTAVDKYFDNLEKSLKGDNPPAKLFTTLKISPEFPLELSYSGNNGYFWSHSAPNVNDTIHVLFDKPQSIKRIVIHTGSREHPKDRLENARLDACLTVQMSNVNTIECYNMIFVGTFLNGNLTADSIQKILPNLKVACLQITVTKSQEWWAIVKEIAVFIK
jgi:alpha-1,3-mannosylglycoprotein beta-1,4-N-acetylglucosaminyltransferase C